MRNCLDRIGEYTNAERRRFKASRLVPDAVTRNLQTLADSSQRLSRSRAPSRRSPRANSPGFAA
jgi:uncharacterized protein with HEPN domain